MLVPVLAKPHLLALKNRWVVSSLAKRSLGRDVTALLIALGTVILIWRGTHASISESARILEQNRHLYDAALTPLLTAFALAVFLASAIRALGVLFLSNDVEFLLAAPLQPRSFFCGKLFNVAAYSFWTYALLGIPIVCAFDSYLGRNGTLVISSSIILFPLVLMAVSLAMIFVVLFATLVPANRTRDVFIGAGCLFGIILLVKTANHALWGSELASSLAGSIRWLATHAALFGPPHWASKSLLHAATDGFRWTVDVTLLYLLAGVMVTGAFFTTTALHFFAYSKSLSPNARQQFDSRRTQRRLRALTPLMTQRYRAFWTKEVRLFARDMTQTLQLVLLLSICILYIYNFRALSLIDVLPQRLEHWWQSLLIAINALTCSLLTSAVCTRFVFPSISLEGSSFWLIQKGPITLIDFLRTKLMVWFYPIALMSIVIGTSGAAALGGGPDLVAITIVTCTIGTYGLIACSIGIGAIFADFDWDYSSQVSATYASFLNMLACIVLSAVNLVPVLLLLSARALRETASSMTQLQWGTALVLSVTILFFINLVTAHWFLGIGESSLTKRLT